VTIKNTIISIFQSTALSVPDALNRSKIPSLDGMRGVSILLVIINHILTYRMGKTGWLTSLFDGNLGVHIFFVISGFLITTILLRQKLTYGRFSLKHFYIRRVLRIFPAAYLYLFVLILLNRPFHLEISKDGFATSFFYLTNFPGEYHYQTAHYWTLALEEQFYILFPASLKIGWKAYALFCVLVLSLYPFIVHFSSHPNPYDLCFVYLYHAWGLGTTSIIIGSLTSLGMFSGFFLTAGKGVPGWALKLGMVVLIYLFHSFGFPAHLNIICCAVCISLFLVLNIFYTDDFIYRALNNKLLIFVGLLSYSLYIWQQLFTAHVPWAHAFPYADSILFNITALILVALASYYFFEKPFLELKKKFV
jgi:peptidoglycan/LPS O-acetylase OafA/YrhL